MGKSIAFVCLGLLLVGACLDSQDASSPPATDAGIGDGGAGDACTGSSCNACPTGHADCDGNPANGCETDTTSDPANCGGCGVACGSANTTSAPTCAAGACQLSCSPGFYHCAPDPSGGCETAESASTCGACGHACGTTACTSQHVCATTTIATNQESPMGLSIDTGSIYWAANGANRIRRAGLADAACDGISCQSIADTTTATFQGASGNGKTKPVATFSDGAKVYFTCNDTNAGVLSVPVGGGTVVLSGGGTGNSFSLLVDNGLVFYTNRTGASGVSVWDENANHDNVIGTTASGTPAPASDAIAVDAGRIYFGDSAQGMIFVRNEGDFPSAVADGKFPCDMTQTGTAPICQKVVDAPGVQHVAAANGFLYWSETASHSVRKMHLVDSKVSSVGTAQNVAVLAADSTGVYWGRADDDTFRYAKSSDAPCDGAACTLVVGTGVGTTPTGLAVSPTTIYVSYLQTSGPNTGIVAKRVK